MESQWFLDPARMGVQRIRYGGKGGGTGGGMGGVYKDKLAALNQDIKHYFVFTIKSVRYTLDI